MARRARWHGRVQGSRWRWRSRLLRVVVLGFPAHRAATTPLARAAAGAGGVLDGIGLAAVIFGLGTAAVLAIGQPLATRLRMTLAAPYSLLAVPPAVGALVFAVQEGNLAGLAGERSALVGGSLAVCLVTAAASAPAARC